jgi:hypothetical protein
MNVLYSKKGSYLLLVYAFFIIVIWAVLERDVFYGGGSLLMCLIYIGFVLQPKPWRARTPGEREAARIIWSFLFAIAFVLSLWIISYKVGVERGSVTASFFGGIGIVVITSFLDRKVSEKYLRTALKEGGIQVYLGPRPEEWDKPTP